MRTKPLTEREAQETLEATRDQIAMVDSPVLDQADAGFRVGDSVVIVRGGRFRTDRAVVRSLAIGDKFTVIDINSAMLTVRDNDGNRFKIRCDYFKHNPKGTR